MDDTSKTSLVGRTLAHYRISTGIGTGGMGEVYRAMDTKLARDVALKVLPPDMAPEPRSSCLGEVAMRAMLASFF